MLTTGEISCALEDSERDDFDLFVCDNGPAVITNLEQMVGRFSTDRLFEWRNKHDSIDD